MIFKTKFQSIIQKTISLTVATTVFFSENNELPSTASFKDRRYSFVIFGDKVRSWRAGETLLLSSVIATICLMVFIL